MNGNRNNGDDWERLRTDETREVERVLREHFQAAHAYRFNSASLRVRIVDAKFKNMNREQRDELVEPILARLNPDTQADIMNLVLLYPGEENDSPGAYLNNFEFEHPLESML